MMYLASSGSVAPINIVGSASVDIDTSSVSAPLRNDPWPRNGVRYGVHTAHFERNSVMPRDTAPTESSSAAYVPSGRRTRSAIRPPNQLPSDSPKKKLATVTLTANVEL